MVPKRSFLSFAHSLQCSCAFLSVRNVSNECHRAKRCSNPQANLLMHIIRLLFSCIVVIVYYSIMPKATFSSKEQRAKKGFSDIRDLFRKQNSKRCNGVKRGCRAQNWGRKKAAAAITASDDVCAHDDAHGLVQRISGRNGRFKTKSTYNS